MALSKIVLFLIVSQLMQFVQACKFTKEAKSGIKLSYKKVEGVEDIYNFSNLSLTFENASKVFECELENGKEIKLTLNYRVKNKPITRKFNIKYNKAKTQYIEYFSPLDNPEEREYCRLLDFQLKSGESEIELGSFHFPGAREAINPHFDAEQGSLEWGRVPRRESCSDGFHVQRFSHVTEAMDPTLADNDDHQSFDLDPCQTNVFKVYPRMTINGDKFLGEPSTAMYNSTLNEASVFNLTGVYLRRLSYCNNSTKNEYMLELGWPHIHNCVSDYDIEISYSNESISSHVKHNTIGTNVSTMIKGMSTSVCQTYTITIKPGNPSEKEGEWYDGMKKILKYADFSFINVTLIKSNESDKMEIAVWDDTMYHNWLKVEKYKVFFKVDGVEFGQEDFLLLHGPNLNLNHIPGYTDRVEDCTNFTLVISPVLSKDSPYKIINDFAGEFHKDIYCDGDPYLVAYIIVGIILGLALVGLIVAAILYRRKKAKEQELMKGLRESNTQKGS